jgi:hydroxymethylbilane synthase
MPERLPENPRNPPASTTARNPARRLRIGTRGSRLALWQAQWVADRLESTHPGLAVELVEIKTQGDRDRTSPLASLGGVGLFTKEIQRALLEGHVDLAVHSLKDLPTIGPPELVLAAVPPRESTADALIAPRHLTLEALPPGARVGTSSLRRAAQLRALRPDLEITPLRGNVETRLRHAAEGRLDAIVLAEAGLRRLGLDSAITQRLGAPGILPAVGQGALGIECRASDLDSKALLKPLDHPQTHRAVLAERALLTELGGGCLVPLGALARQEVDGLWIDASLFDRSGAVCLSTSLGPSSDPVELGRRAASELRKQGAQAIVDSLRSNSGEEAALS